MHCPLCLENIFAEYSNCHSWHSCGNYNINIEYESNSNTKLIYFFFSNRKTRFFIRYYPSITENIEVFPTNSIYDKSNFTVNYTFTTLEDLFKMFVKIEKLYIFS